MTNNEIYWKIKKRLHRWLETAIGNRSSHASFSLEGEDMVLRALLQGKKDGFYVDVGAHHPRRFSNTFYFYRNGWSGINIDPLPGIMEKFNKARPKDINLEYGVSSQAGEMTYYMFEEAAYNTCDEAVMQERLAAEQKLIANKSVKVIALKEIFQKYTKPSQVVDFLSIDVEGFDLEVLKSNDWSLYRPKLVVVEILNASIVEVCDHPISHFLKDAGYALRSKCYNSCIYQAD